MKKIIAVFACLAVALSMSACSSGGETTTSSTGNGESTAPVSSSASDSSTEEASTAPVSSEAPAQDSGAVGDYNVSILDATLSKDYKDKDAIIVTYDFTNNGENETSFMVAISAKAYQDGIELESAIIMDDDFSSEDQMKNIKPGATLTVQKAYVLDNNTSPVEIEVEELISWDDNSPVLTKTFDPASL